MSCFNPFAIGDISSYFKSLLYTVVYSDHEALKYINSHTSVNPKHAR